MKRFGKPVSSSARANGRKNSRLLACFAATLMLIVVSEPKVSLIWSIDFTISASTRCVSSSISPSSTARLMKVPGAWMPLTSWVRISTLGLEGAAEALFQDRLPERLLDLHPRQGLALHAGIEERRRALAAVLDTVHRDVGVLPQRVVALPMLGIEADAD